MNKYTGHAIIIIGATLLQSCALFSGGAKPTIDEIDDRPISQEPQVDFKLTTAQVIQSYRELIDIIPKGKMNGKETQRLADLELEASMDNKLSENENLVKQGHQEASLAIKRYHEYLFTYPNRPDNDLILYQLSRAYAVQSDNEKAQTYMLKLITAFPESQYIDEVQFRRGENFFVDGAYQDAEQSYGVVVNDHPDSVYFEKSLYKYGWSQFKQNRNKEAIDSYIKILDLKQQKNFLDTFNVKETVTRAEKELLEDVLRVTSLSFSYLPSKQPISEYFKAAGKREYEPLLYKNLAELYLSKDRLTDAADIYLSFGENYPFSPYTPVFHSMAIDVYKKAGFTTNLLAEKENYVKKYNKGTAYWNQQTEETQLILQPLLTTHMFDIATHYHATARVSKKSSDYQITATWYQLYLDTFPADKKAAEINFLLAESRFDGKQYAQAITQYEKTAYGYPLHKNSAEAAYAALISYNKLYETSKKEQQPAVKESLIQSALKFSDHFPKDKRTPGVLLKTAEQFFELKKFELARHTASRLVTYPKVVPVVTPVASPEKNPDANAKDNTAESEAKKVVPEKAPETVADTNPKVDAEGKANTEATPPKISPKVEAPISPEISHKAWVIIAHSSFEIADYATAEMSYIQVLSGQKGKTKDNIKKRKNFQEQLALSIYKQGEAQRTLGQHELAASHFMRVGKIVPGSPKKVIADYDAATEYMTLKKWPTAIVLLESFRKSYPKEKKWQKGVTEKLALAYNSSGKHAKAGGEMLSLAEMTPQGEQQDLLWQAADLYNKAGQPKKAVAIYKSYIKKFPTPLSRSIELRYKISQYYAKNKDTKNNVYWLNEIIKADANGKKERTDRTRYLAAISSLELIAPLHKKYSAIKLTIPLKKSLGSKKKLMKNSIAAYTKAAKYQVEEVTTASAYNIAEIYREFANALLKSERPKKLNEEELEEYNYLLEDQAYPFEEKAIGIHETNIARIPNGSFDDNIKKSLTALAELIPFRYAKTEMTDTHAQ